jgi:hypothetical protein
MRRGEGNSETTVRYHPPGGHLRCGRLLGILEAVFALLGTGNRGYALASTAFPFLLLWYLNRSSVKTAFGVTEQS